LASREANNNTLLEYEVLMEPSGQQWLFGIPLLEIDNSSASLSYTSQGEVLQDKEVHQRIKYNATSYLLPQSSEVSLTPLQRYSFTQFPDRFNPLAQQMAKQWRQQSRSDSEYIEKVLNFYRNNFTYTLSPPKLGQHSVDEFLFSSLQGFCEHFSSSFTVLMRSVGIPARVVVGYQGGTWSEDRTYLSIYQRDAHAWAEVWLDGQGWVRVDPTAAVSSVRVNEGLEAALPDSEWEQLNISTSGFPLLKQLYQQWQQFDYQWQRWVLDYDSDKQQGILEKYLGHITVGKMVLLVLIPFATIALFLSFSVFRGLFVPLSEEVKSYRRLQNKLGKLGVEHRVGETVSDYCDRAAKQCPRSANLLCHIKKSFEKRLYGAEGNFDTINQTIKKL